MGAGKKVAIGVGLCLALAISAILMRSTFAAKAGSDAVEPPHIETVGASLIGDSQGWRENWNSEPGDDQIAFYQPSATLTDYRISYEGKVGDRGIGWVFRVTNPKNYYVTRLQVTNAGATPAAVLVHYAVINGENTSRDEKPLPFPLQPDTVYNMRTDVLGTLFSTYVQDQLIDSWTDDRLKSGGFGTLGASTDRSGFGLRQLRAGQ
jgi:hypothetical protein